MIESTILARSRSYRWFKQWNRKSARNFNIPDSFTPNILGTPSGSAFTEIWSIRYGKWECAKWLPTLCRLILRFSLGSNGTVTD